MTPSIKGVPHSIPSPSWPSSFYVQIPRSSDAVLRSLCSLWGSVRWIYGEELGRLQEQFLLADLHFIEEKQLWKVPRDSKNKSNHGEIESSHHSSVPAPGTSEDAVEFIFCGHLLLSMQPSLRVVWFPSGTPMGETRFSFASDYHLEIASGLEMEKCVHLSFRLSEPIWCRPVHILCTLLQSLRVHVRICPVDSSHMLWCLKAADSQSDNWGRETTFQISDTWK